MRHHDPINTADSITIFDSDLTMIAAEAVRADRLETGGDLAGLYSRRGRPRIMLAAGPAPGATHQGAHFAQELEACRRMNWTLEAEYGIQMIGTWHSHSYLGLNEPSTGDLHQVRAISTRNQLDRWFELVLTLEAARHQALGANWLGAYAHTGRDLPLVRVNAFEYHDPQSGGGRRVRLHVLPGVSPLRQALRARGSSHGIQLGEGLTHPRDRILFESADVAAPRVREEPVLEGLAAELEKLPMSVQQQLELYTEGEVAVVAVKLPNGQAAHIACSRDAPHRVAAVYLLRDESGDTGADDVTQSVLRPGGGGGLADTYDRLAELVVATSSQRIAAPKKPPKKAPKKAAKKASKKASSRPLKEAPKNDEPPCGAEDEKDSRGDQSVQNPRSLTGDLECRPQRTKTEWRSRKH